MTARRIGDSIGTGIRWGARIAGPVVAVLCAWMLVQPDARVFQWLARSDLAGAPLHLVMAAAAGAGAVAWWREAAGGFVAFGGGVLILAVASLEPGSGLSLTTFVLTLPLLAIGFARMLGALLSRVLDEEGASPACAREGSKWAAAGGV